LATAFLNNFSWLAVVAWIAIFVDQTPRYQSVEKAIPGFFDCRLAKDASANLSNFLAL